MQAFPAIVIAPPSQSFRLTPAGSQAPPTGQRVSSKSRRGRSRASTASIQSDATHMSLPHDGREYYHDHARNVYDQSAENLILQSAQHLQNPDGYNVDPSLSGQVNYTHSYPDSTTFVPDHSQVSHASAPFGTFEVGNTQMTDASLDQDFKRGQTEDTPEPDPDTKKANKAAKAKATSLQNDLELRKMFDQSRHRSLQDLALQLQNNERGPQSEKIRQTFAMIWLNTSAKKGDQSVPRNRVYSNYVARCGVERVGFLNPASFGKLVRVMFPGIQTRRLGMRGESKYHYCGLSLIDDQTEAERSAPSKSNRHINQKTSLRSQPIAAQQISLPQDTAVFPVPSQSQSPISPQYPLTQPSVSLVFPDSKMASFDFASKPKAIKRELRFMSKPCTVFSDKEPLNFPDIRDYVPPGTDHDTYGTLAALYRTHCTTLIDSVRFCRDKNFFHSLSSLHGTLTVPVQKLFAQPSIAPWIYKCDWIMYQTLIRVVAPLTQQVVPQQIMGFLKSVSEGLTTHIRNALQNYPNHVLEARLGPASVFSSLLDRLLKVNLSAHAAAKHLCHISNRDAMYEEWLAFVQPVKVVENELPGSGHQKVFSILTNEIKDLLSPLSDDWEFGSPHAHPPSSESTDSVLDPWTNFLASLQSRFSKADARTIIHILNSVGSACLRDITMGGGKSFGSWWITKTWLDEMAMWLAEMGGFLEGSGTNDYNESESGQNGHAIEQEDGPSTHDSQNNSRFSSISADIGGSGLERSVRQNTAPSQIAPRTTNFRTTVAPDFDPRLTHDDSGIGMHMSDQEMSMIKLDSSTDAAVHGASDLTNGEVLVC